MKKSASDAPEKKSIIKKWLIKFLLQTVSCSVLFLGIYLASKFSPSIAGEIKRQFTYEPDFSALLDGTKNLLYMLFPA